MIMVWDEFECVTGSQATGCDWEGRLATGTLHVGARQEWMQSATWWREQANAFLAQLANAQAQRYFPQFVEATGGLVVAPQLRIKPAGQPTTYHWQDWQNPLFVPHPNDGALRWDLVQWRDDL